MRPTIPIGLRTAAGEPEHGSHRLPRLLVCRAEAAASANNTTKNNIIRQALQDWLDRSTTDNIERLAMDKLQMLADADALQQRLPGTAPVNGSGIAKLVSDPADIEALADWLTD